ncbi:hypothetical protein CDL12_29020 [Handroanthus impetiginosus]|uniref:Uncharacterized protein n=1 Tax=Handroanthus impetiginosus TaxID=429701 RepID=A0A2G9FZK3_9LAMI|nr:hypothetical protein CDL12_29020 [Handroanthus impetiginosus]
MAQQSTPKHGHKFPPERGQIKIKIFRSLVKSVGQFFDESKRRKGKALSSTSTTPHETPSGYNSGDEFYK